MFYLCKDIKISDRFLKFGLKKAKQHLVFLLFSKYFCIKLIRVSVILLPAHEKVFIFAAVTKEVAAAFLFAKLTDKVTDPVENRKFAAYY